MGLQESINREIMYAQSLLDLCAGPGTLTAACPGIKTAVELNPKYAIKLRNNGYSNVYIQDVRDINYPAEQLNSSVTIWIDGIEHLKEKDAIKVLDDAEKHTDKMLVFTPNEFISNKDSADHLDEPLQVHLSVFPEEFWIARGYEVIYREYNTQAKVNNILYKKVFK